METDLLNYFAAHPWATAGDAARALGCDRANVKRDSKKLAQRGLLQYRINGQAYEWAVANGGGQTALPEPISDLMARPAIGSGSTDNAPIEGTWREVATQATAPASPAPGRELVTAEQPADSRMAAALTRIAAAQRRGDGYNGHGGHMVQSGLARVLDGLHIGDPHGDESLAAAAAAYNANAAATRSAVQVVEQARKAEQSRALVAVRPEPSLQDMLGYGISRLIQARSQEIERQYRERAQPALVTPAAEQPRIDRVKQWHDQEQERDQQPRDLSPDEFDDDELAEIDERAREIVENEDELDTPPSSPEPREDGLRRVNPKLHFRPTFSERRAAARRKAAEEFLAEREEVEVEELEREETEAAEPVGIKPLREILRAKKTKPMSEPAPTSRWERWFGIPKKAVWK